MQSAQTISPWYGIGANVVATNHALFVGFVVWGEIFILVGGARDWTTIDDPVFRLTHLGCVLYIGIQDLFGKICPLTSWERQLRALAGQTCANTPFIGRIIHRLMMCQLSERTQKIMRLSFAGIVLVTFILLPPRGIF
jgi:hypothetical protein